ncbi:MAG: cell division protein FtsL [Nitrospirae bacterium]|nr:cell division protein FtsL [Nitrospirota bacterium]
MKTLTILAGVMLVFVFVWERVDVVRVGYQIERSKSQKILLERERDQLQVKVSSLMAPERIAKVATEKLGLVPPQQGQVLMVHQPNEAPGQSLPSVAQVRLASRIIAMGRVNE